jgi:transcriptional regulator with XRE-family HTH domain
MTGDGFKAWRKRAGLTQSGAATKFGFTLQTVFRWEKGQSPIPAEVNVQIAEDAVAEEHGPGLIKRASELLPKPAEPIEAGEVEYVWMGGQQIALPPGMKATTPKEYAAKHARRDLKTGKLLERMVGPYKGGPIPPGHRVVRLCRVPIDPTGQPWAAS